MKTIFAIFLLIAACSTTAVSQTGKKYYTDTALVDQDGRRHRLWSDLMKGKTVVVIPFNGWCVPLGPPLLHSDCAGTEALLMEKMKAVQEELRGRAGEFNILALSVNEADAPERSKAVAEKYKLGPNFYLLTGDRKRTVRLAEKFGVHIVDRTQGGVIIKIGNTKTGLWNGGNGMDEPSETAKDVLWVMDGTNSSQ
jgi:protein SCO1/2